MYRVLVVLLGFSFWACAQAHTKSHCDMQGQKNTVCNVGDGTFSGTTRFAEGGSHGNGHNDIYCDSPPKLKKDEEIGVKVHAHWNKPVICSPDDVTSGHAITFLDCFNIEIGVTKHTDMHSINCYVRKKGSATPAYALTNDPKKK